MQYNAELKKDRLLLETGRIRRSFVFNNGNLISEGIEDLETGSFWLQDNNKGFRLPWDPPTVKTDFAFPGKYPEPQSPFFKCREITSPIRGNPHLQVQISFQLDQLEVMREFKLFANSPAIACNYYFRGRTDQKLLKTQEDMNTNPIEGGKDGLELQITAPMLEKVITANRHLKYYNVNFFDITDRHNNLVEETEFIPFRYPRQFSGNILSAYDILTGEGFFIIKEAACPQVQISYPGFDFIVSINRAEVYGAGIDQEDLDEKLWIRAYGFVTGLSNGGAEGLKKAIRQYRECARSFCPQRDDMILLNTWGDRSQDRKLSEPFILNELEHASRLGLTHLQLDAGWQEMNFSNLLNPDEIWNSKAAWSINKKRFPNGFQRIVDAAKQKNIELCVWFAPCSVNDYDNWSNEADVLIDLYRKFNIRIFKIDGVKITSRKGENNFRSFLDKIVIATDREAVFNLDTTSGRRFGYNYFNEYGNYFIENRYTDWANYYPHWVLRNLWQLAHYVPPQYMQFEFLNKWRNSENYAENDPFAPVEIPFEYCFAVTMAAQPLAWFEASEIPKEADKIADTIKTYQLHQADFHRGTIMPIGEKPDGTSWTGFHSDNGGKGYLLIFREYNTKEQKNFHIPSLSQTCISAKIILGRGEDFICNIDREAKLQFFLSDQFSFALYKYEKIRGKG